MVKQKTYFIEKYKNSIWVITLGSNKKSKAYGFYKKLGFVEEEKDKEGVGLRLYLK